MQTRQPRAASRVRPAVASDKRDVQPSRWELRTCGRSGRVTYVPDEAELAGRLSGRTGAGTVWRCLRCGDFVLGAPKHRGPADQAPLVLRGKALRSAIILRLLALERVPRTLLLSLRSTGCCESSPPAPPSRTP